MKSLCLFNPDASGWEASGETLRRLAATDGVPHCSVREKATWLKKLRTGEVTRLIICGGDGSLSATVNQLQQERLLEALELAILPLGTGNDFSRSIGFSGVPIEDVWKANLERAAVPVDLIRVSNGNEQLLVNAATGGFGGLVTHDIASGVKQQWGALSYWVTAFSHLGSLDQYQIHLELDDRLIKESIFGLVVSSGQFVGGGFPIAPQSIINDGLLDVTVIPEMPMVEALAAGAEFSLGDPDEGNRIPSYQAKKVRIKSTPSIPYSLDGEASRSFDATFEVLPHAMKIVTAETAPGIVGQNRKVVESRQ